MKSIARWRRETFLERARIYTDARVPTDAAAQALCSAFAEMLAADRGERVMVVIGTVVIARSVAVTAQQGVTTR
ncbi:hypothetical protein [Paraburkholderia xenovorans]